MEGAFLSLLEGFKGKKKKISSRLYLYVFFFFYHNSLGFWVIILDFSDVEKKCILSISFFQNDKRSSILRGRGGKKKDSLIASGLESLNFTECFRNAGRGTWSPGTYSFVKLVVQLLNRVRFFATPWTVPCQVPLSTGFYRQEYWSGLPLASPKKFY